ncbi:MAG: hypothetical protein JNM17_35990 [Archangium sp.]|nr:hypothetical protein [Archangium sp.]
MRPVIFTAVLSLVACTKGTSAPAVIDAGVALVDDCTYDTKLVAGIPGSPGHLIASERNPNGASELATLMRTFVDDWRAARVALDVDGGSPAAVSPKFPTHRKIRCSWPTDAADRNPTFDGFAKNYVRAVKAFDAQPGREKYEGVLDACKACHEVSCGGPLEVIEGLRWK